MSDPLASDLLEPLLEFTSDFIMIADAEGKPIAFNRAYARLIEQAIGLEVRPGVQPHKVLADPEAVAMWDELHRRVLGGEQFSVEVAQPFPDGVRHFSITFNPIIRDGKVAGFCELSRDITDRVLAEEALRESERTLRESQEVARIGSFRCDLSTGRWHCTAMLDSLLGIDSTVEHTIEAWVAVVHPEWRDEMVRYFQEDVVGKRQTFDREYMIRRPSDGADRWVHGLGQLVLDDSGTPIAMIGTIRDITERRELEDRVRQQEKLEALGQLAGGVAHDFNNQLVAVLGFADLIRSKVAHDPELGRFAQNIVTCAHRAAELTRQLLAFSRKGKYLAVRVDLNELLHEVSDVLHHTIDPRITIVQRLRATRAVTVGDPSQLQNAVLNLALNARDAMPDGGELVLASDLVELDAAACARLPMELDPGRYVVITVIDTGPGIERALQRRIFEPFFTTKGLGQGTGMGLAAVYGTAKNHHGCIEVDSEPGRGAAFRLYLPLASQPDQARTVEPPARPSNGGSAHVLVVEDEPAVRNATRAMLAACGYAVTTCGNGAEAVDLYRERWQGIDVVVLDMVMPVMSGHEAFLAMQKINPGLRVVVSSGHSLRDDAQNLVSKGVRTTLQKPFRVDELEQAILHALSD